MATGPAVFLAGPGEVARPASGRAWVGQPTCALGPWAGMDAAGCHKTPMVDADCVFAPLGRTLRRILQGSGEKLAPRRAKANKTDVIVLLIDKCVPQRPSKAHKGATRTPNGPRPIEKGPVWRGPAHADGPAAPRPHSRAKKPAGYPLRASSRGSSHAIQNSRAATAMTPPTMPISEMAPAALTPPPTAVPRPMPRLKIPE